MPLDLTPPSGEDVQNLVPLVAQSISPSYFQATSNSNEVIIICNQMVPLIDPYGALSSIGRLSPLMMLRLSPQAAKDLAMVLAENVRQLEEEFGPITTAHMKMQQAKTHG